MEDQGSSLYVAALAFVEELSQESALSRASKALHAEINIKEKPKSPIDMDISDGFVPSETSVCEIVWSELHLSSGRANRVNTIR